MSIEQLDAINAESEKQVLFDDLKMLDVRLSKLDRIYSDPHPSWRPDGMPGFEMVRHSVLRE